MRRTATRLGAVLLLLLLVLSAAGQQATAPLTKPSAPPSEDFLRTADEVMAEVSRLIALPVKAPLKKGVRTREEIREHLLRQLKEDKDAAKRYADQRALEKFGLLPKNFGLEAFLVDLLTEQIEGFYDPKEKAFFIASSVQAGDQLRIVLAHELVHALQDQHFDIDKWADAAKPNDDAEFARHAVLEGSATAAMMDHLLGGGEKVNIRTMPDIGAFIREGMAGEMSDNPQLAKAPPFLRNMLLFPYVSGAVFTQQVLKAGGGWDDFKKVFEEPPASTQHILHPQLYLAGITAKNVSLPDLTPFLPAGWKRLDENVLGEFALQEVLKQFLGEARAERLAPAWAGDRYAVYEHQKTRQVILALRLRLESVEAAQRFFGGYSELLEVKNKAAGPRGLYRRPGFFQFESPEGGVFLQCRNLECMAMEGTTRLAFDKAVRAMGWPLGPRPGRGDSSVVTTAALPVASTAGGLR